jgi:hypothetical protein
MGAIQESNAIFLTISNGKICKKVQKKTAISVERVNKNGVTVQEEYYKGWKGLITAIAVREHKDFGKFWNVTLTDDQGDAILQMNYSSGYAAAFLKTLPNIDLKSDVVITPNLKVEGAKKKTTVFVSQHGVPIKWYFTKDNRNGLPELKKIKIKGKETWDDSDLMEFLEKMVMANIVPKLPKGRTAGGTTSIPDIEEVEAEEIGNDDLPF